MAGEEIKKQRDAFAALRIYWGEVAASAGEIAHARKTLFDAYCSEGFTEDQALRLTMAPIMGTGS